MSALPGTLRLASGEVLRYDPTTTVLSNWVPIAVGTAPGPGP